MLYAVVGNVDWCSRYGKWYGSFSKHLKEDYPRDPTISFGVYSRMWKGTEKLFVHPCSYQHYSHPSKNGWTKQSVIYSYNGLLFNL